MHHTLKYCEMTSFSKFYDVHGWPVWAASEFANPSSSTSFTTYNYTYSYLPTFKTPVLHSSNLCFRQGLALDLQTWSTYVFFSLAMSTISMMTSRTVGEIWTKSVGAVGVGVTRAGFTFIDVCRVMKSKRDSRFVKIRLFYYSSNVLRCSSLEYLTKSNAPLGTTR